LIINIPHHDILSVIYVILLSFLFWHGFDNVNVVFDTLKIKAYT